LQRVERLGQMGDIVKVKPGYARNFLIPQNVAVRATAEKIEEFKTKKAQLEAQNLKLKEEAQAVAGKMDGLVVVIVRQAGESGQLYGSVRSLDVSEAITKAGFTTKSSQVKIPDPVKTLGVHYVRVILHPEVEIEVGINVALSEEEAVAQLANAQKEAR
ncbi:MAG: 50S ribosomal protein L9, partial [Candidatus Nucleicultricaceae bacterium]